MAVARERTAYLRFQAWLIARSNPHLLREVTTARQALGIPAAGFASESEAGRWERQKAVAEGIPKRKAKLHAGHEQLLRFLRDMLLQVELEPRLPSDRAVLRVVERFHLPPWVAPWVKAFLLSGDRAGPATWPAPWTVKEWRQLFLPLMKAGDFPAPTKRDVYYIASPPFPRVLIPLDPQRRYWATIIVGLSESTTGDDWELLWQSLRPWIVRDNPRRRPNKRLTDDLAVLRRDLRLWQLVRQEGKSANAAMDAYQAESGSILDSRQLRRALRRIDALMKPEEESAEEQTVARGQARVEFSPGARLAGRPMRLPPGAPPIKRGGLKAEVLRPRREG